MVHDFTSIDLGMLQFITSIIEVTYFPRFSYFALSEPGSPGNGWREFFDLRILADFGQSFEMNDD